MDEMTFDLSERELAMLDQILEEAHTSNNEEESKEEKTIIPANSESLLIDTTSSRFSSAAWFDTIQKQEVLLAGIGGIGSYIAFLLSRIKIGRLVLYDFDKVEEHNLSGQLYSIDDARNGVFKVLAMKDFLRNYSDYFRVFAMNNSYNVGSLIRKIMICGFDNMQARKTFFNNWKTFVLSLEHKEECLFIDGRLAAEEFQVLCIKGTDTYLMDKYEKEWLFTDDEAEPTLCSYKQTSFCANMIASVIVNLVVNFAANLCNPLIERPLPFLTTYDAERMHFKIEL